MIPTNPKGGRQLSNDQPWRKLSSSVQRAVLGQHTLTLQHCKVTGGACFKCRIEPACLDHSGNGVEMASRSLHLMHSLGNLGVGGSQAAYTEKPWRIVSHPKWWAPWSKEWYFHLIPTGLPLTSGEGRLHFPVHISALVWTRGITNQKTGITLDSGWHRDVWTHGHSVTDGDFLHHRELGNNLNKSSCLQRPNATRVCLILYPLSQRGYDLCTDELKKVDSDTGLSV